ncbi:MAG: hypothetical protein JNK42_05980 [Caedimonas sp.]|nr:hypothetical protein [Caedimonas sp.]
MLKKYFLNIRFSAILLTLIFSINGHATKLELDDVEKNNSHVSLEDNHYFEELETMDSSQKTGLSPVSIVGLGVDLILNVAGGSAAFWGVTDVFQLRDETNNDEFRIAAMVIGGVALTRYFIITAMNNEKYKDYLKAYHKGNGWGRFVKSIEDPVSSLRSTVKGLVCKVTHNKNVG